MQRLYLGVLGASLSLACTNTVSDPGTSIFSAKGPVTPNSVLGIWERPPQTALDVTAVTRFEFRADSVVMASRCTRGAETKTPSVTLAGQVTSDKITFSESKAKSEQIGQVLCGVQTSAGTIARCAAGLPEAQRQLCFALEGIQLTIYQPGGAQPMTKVAD